MRKLHGHLLRYEAQVVYVQHSVYVLKILVLFTKSQFLCTCFVLYAQSPIAFYCWPVTLALWFDGEFLSCLKGVRCSKMHT